MVSSGQVLRRIRDVILDYRLTELQAHVFQYYATKCSKIN